MINPLLKVIFDIAKAQAPNKYPEKVHFSFRCQWRGIFRGDKRGDMRGDMRGDKSNSDYLLNRKNCYLDVKN